MLSHTRSPPPPLCAFRCSSRDRWQWVILLRRNATPLIVGTVVWSRFRTISHIVVRPPLVRKTPDGPETRPDGWFRRTKGGGRPSQVLCGPAGPNLAVIHQPTEAPHATPEFSRWFRARRPTRHFGQIPSITIPADRMWRGVGNSKE